MLSRVAFAMLCLLLAAAAPLHAEDLTGRWGAGGFFGAGIPTGGDYIQSHGSAGDAWGLFLRYGVDPNWGVELAYDHMSFNGVGLRLGDVTVDSLYSFFPDRRWTPVLIGGLGFGEGEGSLSENNFALRAGIGLEYFLTPDLSAGAQALYNFVSDTGNADNASLATTLGITLTAYFGPRNEREEAAARPAPPAPPPAPPPPPPAPTPPPPAPAPLPRVVAVATPPAPAPVVTVLVSPREVTLTEFATAQFEAAVSTGPSAVSWALSPASGTISPAGLYTAPGSIASSMTVTITARSLAASSATATALVSLVPEAKIELNIQFDPYSDVVKPQYDADIARVADYLKAHPGVKAEVQGHTDDSGWLLRNMRLSQKRADAVRQVLIQKFAVDPARVTAKGYGPTRPIADNATPEGRAKNRRVVVVFSGP